MSSRFALGTVQFGLPYGIANTAGQVSHDETQAILRLAAAMGLDTLDTAMSYGDSEPRLGEIGVADWNVVTKLPPNQTSSIDVAEHVRQSVMASLERLRIPKLRGLLLHRSSELAGSQGSALYASLLALKREGLVEKVGVSIYDPGELDALWPQFALDLVQAPFNVLDRRLVSSGWLTRLHDTGVEVHVRSIFLQGLLLMDAAALPAQFRAWQRLWDAWHRWLVDARMSALEACLSVALSQPEFARVVIGVESTSQLREILRSAEQSTTGPIPPTALATDDPDLINPSRWSSQ